MNERIDELMIQAGARFEFLHGVHYDDFQYRKFAELIVRECITICQHNADDDDDQFDLGRAHQAKEITHLIKKHFGVEE